MRTWTAGDQKIPVFGYVLTNLRAAPPAPTLTGVSVKDNQSAKITWAAPKADSRRPLSGYHIWMRTDDGEFERITDVQIPADTFEYTYNNLKADTSYTFAVTSANNSGTVSTLSNTKTFSTFAGADGREIEFRNDGNNIQWRYSGEDDNAYRNLVSLTTLTGKDGADGKQIELRVYNGFVQWKYSDDSVWNDLIALSELKGDKGDKGDTGEKGDKGDKGDPGKTGVSGQDGKDGVTPQLKIGDDNFWYVSYDGGQNWTSLGVKATGEKGDTGKSGKQGKKGDKGDRGEPGKDGTLGQNAENGEDSKNAVGIANAEINADGELLLTYTDGTTANLGKVVGENGKDGLTPYIGENGNWWIGEKDTGTKATADTAVAENSKNTSASATSPAMIAVGSVAGTALLSNFGLILYIVLKKKKSLV